MWSRTLDIHDGAHAHNDRLRHSGNRREEVERDARLAAVGADPESGGHSRPNPAVPSVWELDVVRGILVDMHRLDECTICAGDALSVTGAPGLPKRG